MRSRIEGPRGWRIAPILGALLLCVACDGELVASGPVEICREVGTQCVLRDGPLGVCESIACPPGGAPPCLVCTPQH